jgi:alkanesulfonate monooxygenase SsuD/methylene tetrahydromethanopterin reductase-like flavin-dependent oxidoreductase (luciferase family)
VAASSGLPLPVTDLGYWNEEARLLEAGCFDALFLADVLGTYERAPGDSAHALRIAHQIPVNDPLLLVPALAQVTTQLGFAVTVSATLRAAIRARQADEHARSPDQGPHRLKRGHLLPGQRRTQLRL